MLVIIFNNEYDSIGRRVMYMANVFNDTWVSREYVLCTCVAVTRCNILKIILVSKCVAKHHSRTVKGVRPAERLDDVGVNSFPSEPFG